MCLLKIKIYTNENYHKKEIFYEKRYYITKETTEHATRTTSTDALGSSETSGSVIRAASTGASGVSNTSNNVIPATSREAIGSANNNINDFNQDYNPQLGILYGYINYLDNNGKWVTINGNHVFIED